MSVNPLNLGDIERPLGHDASGCLHRSPEEIHSWQKRKKNDPALHYSRSDRRLLNRVSCNIGRLKLDTDEADEVLDLLAKTVAELTCRQHGLLRQQPIGQLMREKAK